MKPGLALLALLSTALACVEQSVFEDQLVLGTLDAERVFVAYVRGDDDRYLVEVVRGFQGADMVVVVVELPSAYAGDQVDLTCWIETASWSSREREHVFEDVLVPGDRQLYAPYLILDWWAGEATQAELGCEITGSRRIDVTTLDVWLVPP